MPKNQKLTFSMVSVKGVKVGYDKVGDRMTTISFDVNGLDLRIERELVAQAMAQGAVNIELDFLQATMFLPQVDDDGAIRVNSGGGDE